MGTVEKRVVKKSELVNGMLVEVTDSIQDKSIYVVVKGMFGEMDTLINPSGWFNLESYDENLQPKYDRIRFKITAVYFRNYISSGWTWITKNDMWRKVEVAAAKEMTLSEIEDELGYSIILKEEEKDEDLW
jgi:hypothetical protein